MNRPFPARPGNRVFSWLASSVNELAIVFWTCGSFYMMYASGGQNEYFLFAPLALGAAAFFWLSCRKPVIAHVDQIVSIGVFLLVFSILGSYLFNSENYELIAMAGNVVSTLLLFFALYVVVMKIEMDLKKVLVLQAIVINLLLPVILASSNWVWGRLEPAQLHPNYVAMMGTVAALGAMSVRSPFWMVVLGAMPLYTMSAMQSRASMIATTSGVVIVICHYLWVRRSRQLLGRLAVLAMIGAAACIALSFVGVNVFGAIGDQISGQLLLDDDRRGLGSGASGRSDLWAAAFNLWATHPLFGVGFKGHTQFMPDNMPAHNAFLGLLADNGLIGFIGYMIIIGRSAYCLVTRGSKHVSMFAQRAAIIFPYFLYGLVETRAFSFGNSYSLIFLLVAFDSAKTRVQPSVFTPSSPQTAMSKEANLVRQFANH
jgi:O-antigen ligase